VLRHSLTSSIAVDGATPNRPAAPRQLMPSSSTARIMRRHRNRNRSRLRLFLMLASEDRTSWFIGPLQAVSRAPVPISDVAVTDAGSPPVFRHVERHEPAEVGKLMEAVSLGSLRRELKSGLARSCLATWRRTRPRIQPMIMRSPSFQPAESFQNAIDPLVRE
jgi:hypothetical protein